MCLSASLRKEHVLRRALVTTVFVLVLVAGNSKLMALDEQQAESGVIFSEIMYKPASEFSSELASWFEIFNPTDEHILLSELVITSGISTVDQEMTWAMPSGELAPGAFLTVGASHLYQLNGGVQIDLCFGGGLLQIDPSGGRLEIYHNDILQDRLDYGGNDWAIVPYGHSASLEPNAATAILNDDPGAWCASGILQFGSPDGEISGFFSPSAWGEYCDSDGDGYSESDLDCDDSDPQTNPGISEKCNGKDDNCDGTVDGEDELKNEMNCYFEGVCEGVVAFCSDGGEWLCPYPDSYEEEEQTCDGQDNDCDGTVDEGLLNNCGLCAESELDLCDGVDNDCDGTTDEDAGMDELETCSYPETGVCLGLGGHCEGSNGWQCEVPEGYEEIETVCDQLDNDCDGEVDEGHGIGEPCVGGEGACEQVGQRVCAEDGLSSVCDVEAWLVGMELCGDNIDNDCNGETDEGYPVNETCFAGVGVCRVAGKFQCSYDRNSVVCSAVEAMPQEEICDNFLDDDCDGEIDEDGCNLSAGQGSNASCSSSPLSSFPGRSWLVVVSLLSILAVLATSRVRQLLFPRH